MKPFMVKPEWREIGLCIGGWNLGRVYQIREAYIAVISDGLGGWSNLGTLPTEAAARAAVEAAVERELAGGE